jgi:hypothetical protein
VYDGDSSADGSAVTSSVIGHRRSLACGSKLVEFTRSGWNQRAPNFSKQRMCGSRTGRSGFVTETRTIVAALGRTNDWQTPDSRQLRRRFEYLLNQNSRQQPFSRKWRLSPSSSCLRPKDDQYLKGVNSGRSICCDARLVNFWAFQKNSFWRSHVIR